MFQAICIRELHTLGIDPSYTMLHLWNIAPSACAAAGVWSWLKSQARRPPSYLILGTHSDGCIKLYLWVSINVGTPKWMVYTGKSLKNWGFRGTHGYPKFMETPMSILRHLRSFDDPLMNSSFAKVSTWIPQRLFFHQELPVIIWVYLKLTGKAQPPQIPMIRSHFPQSAS